MCCMSANIGVCVRVVERSKFVPTIHGESFAVGGWCVIHITMFLTLRRSRSRYGHTEGPGEHHWEEDLHSFKVHLAWLRSLRGTLDW